MPMVRLYEDGFLSCRKHKRDSIEYMDFAMHLVDWLPALRNSVLYGTYEPDPLRAFLVDQPVLREIFAPRFKDRVDQLYIASLLEPLLEKELIYDCYSCRKGKGTLFGVRRLHRFIAQCSNNYQGDAFVLLCDLSGYFMSIDRNRLWNRLEAFLRRCYFGDDLELLLYQLHQFIFHPSLKDIDIRGNRKKWRHLPDSKSLFKAMGTLKPDAHEGGYTVGDMLFWMGLIIGALPSQMLSNFYLSPFDHYCKHELGLRYYGRYVDDFFVVHQDRAFLESLIPLLRSFLESLGLTLHPEKIRIVHYRQGVPYLGAFIKGGAILPGKRIQANFRRLLMEVDRLPLSVFDRKVIERYCRRINSYLGLLRQYNAKGYVRRMFAEHPVLRMYFWWEDCTVKVECKFRRYDRMDAFIWNKAMGDYHEQFRLCFDGPFQSKGACFLHRYLFYQNSG